MSRRILAYEMMLSAKEVPHVCYIYEPEISAFWAYFKDFKARHGLSISFNTLMLKAITECMKVSPVLNSHLLYNFRSAKGTLRTFEKIDVNMPTILPSGEMQALTIRDAAAGGLLDLDRKIKDLLEKAEDEIAFGKAQYDLGIEQTIGFLKKGKIITVLSRLFGAYFGKERLQTCGCNNQLAFVKMARKHLKTVDKSKVISKDDIREGTVIVSNVGSLKKDLKGETAYFEILPPQIFAVMIGNVQRKPVVTTDAEGKENVSVGTVLPITLAFDHRACDFDALIPFINKFDEIFATPSVMEALLYRPSFR